MNIFNKSIYFNVFGTILELPYSTYEDENKKFIYNNSFAMHSEWIVDYTGKLYKNRNKKSDHVTSFLNSDRKETFKFSNYSDAKLFCNNLITISNNYRKYVEYKEKNI